MVETPRMDLARVAPDALNHLIQIERSIAGKLDAKLVHLIKLRASQINGCAFCLAMHTDEALRDGESTERLTLLNAWAESSLYSDKERAALEWVEEITLISETGASSEAFEGLKPHFSEEEIAWLTVAAAMINCFNRLATAARSKYDRKMFQHPTREQKVAEPA
jgi:AhpD family alkylhydroperoxidase